MRLENHVAGIIDESRANQTAPPVCRDKPRVLLPETRAQIARMRAQDNNIISNTALNIREAFVLTVFVLSVGKKVFRISSTAHTSKMTFLLVDANLY